MGNQFHRFLISACLAAMTTGPSYAQDSFSGYSPTFRSFWTGHAVKELTSSHPSALVEKAEINLSFCFVQFTGGKVWRCSKQFLEEELLPYQQE